MQKWFDGLEMFLYVDNRKICERYKRVNENILDLVENSSR